MPNIPILYFSIDVVLRFLSKSLSAKDPTALGIFCLCIAKYYRFKRWHTFYFIYHLPMTYATTLLVAYPILFRITVTSLWGYWRFKYPAYPLFADLSVQAQVKEISKLCATGLCEGNSPVTGEFPAQRASNAENVSIRWRHHGRQLMKTSSSSLRLYWVTTRFLIICTYIIAKFSHISFI